MVIINASALLAFSALSLGTLLLPGCSSSDDNGGSDPVSECKSLTASECMKFYQCFTDDERAGQEDTVGTSESDCEAKISADQCGTADTTCDSGKTYHADKAEQCIKDFKALSCDQFRAFMSATDLPASCNDVCS